MNNIKAGILTFHWADDYGAMLQAYGLKTALMSMGIDADVIPYAPYKFIGRYFLLPYEPYEGYGGKFSKKSFGRGKSRLRYNIRHIFSFLKRRMIMKEFRKRYVCSLRPIRKAGNVRLDRYDVLVVGSDQVWNPALTVGFDGLYMGSQKGDRRLISYAASFGGSRLDDRYSDAFGEYLNNYDAISMREKSAVSYVKEHTKKGVYTVLDPTLLLEKDKWEKIMRCPGKKGYILIYDTSVNENLQKYAHDLSLRTGKKVIRLSSVFMKTAMKQEGFDFDPVAGPSEFLGYFNNADFIVTNSFHGTCISIVFNRPMAVFGYKDRSARMIDFLDSIGLKERFVENAEEREKDVYNLPIDWEHVRANLSELRKNSIEYLETNIGI